MAKLSKREVIHRILYYGLIEMREQGRVGRDSVVYHLADLLHNVPGQLSSARASNEEEYEQILDSLRQKAEEIGCTDWLKQRLAQMGAASDQGPKTRRQNPRQRRRESQHMHDQDRLPEDVPCISVNELRKLPPEQQARILEAQAAYMEPFYRNDPELTDFEAFELEAEFLDGDTYDAEAR